MFDQPLGERLEYFARLLEPHAGRLDAAFTRRMKSGPWALACDPLQLAALLQITSGAAARLLSNGRSLADFLEQVSYNGRRLAKLNVSPAEVVHAIREYEDLVEPLLANRYARDMGGFEAARARLYFCSVLTVNNAFYQVREAETQAFYGLLRAEMDAVGLDDLLRRSIAILTRTFRAQAGRLILIDDQPPLAAGTLKRLSRPRYIRGGSIEEEFILDAAMRSHQSYWSIPFFSSGRLAGLIQLGFSTPYQWLPRELDLLGAFAERCLRAAERTRLLQNLAMREEQVRGLAGHLMQAEEEERRRVSRELHDEAGQSLMFLRLQLEMLERAAPAALLPKLTAAREVAERIIVEIRRLIAALSPSVLDELGLPAAIRQLGARFRKLCPARLQMRIALRNERLPRDAEAAVYRVAQECYQNIAKHAGASRVNLSLRAADGILELDVEDDGIGFDLDSALAQPNSFGLKGMRERVALLGGRLEIHSSPGRGTHVSVRLSMPTAADAGSALDHDYGKDPNVINRRPHLVPAGNQNVAGRRT